MDNENLDLDMENKINEIMTALTNSKSGNITNEELDQLRSQIIKSLNDYKNI